MRDIKQRVAVVRVLHLVEGAEGVRAPHHLTPWVIPIDMVWSDDTHHHPAPSKTAIPRSDDTHHHPAPSKTAIPRESTTQRPSITL